MDQPDLRKCLGPKKGSSLFYLNDSNLLFSISSADYQSFESISAPMDCVDKTCRAMECKIKILALIKTNRYNVNLIDDTFGGAFRSNKNSWDLD